MLLFGSFDPLHEGHKNLFTEAKKLGSHLTVVVDRDASIRNYKRREPHIPQAERMAAVQQVSDVDEALLGDENPGTYHLLRTLPYNILALGYDQTPSDQEVAELLLRLNKKNITIVRLNPYQPQKYKSSYYRP